LGSRFACLGLAEPRRARSLLLSSPQVGSIYAVSYERYAYVHFYKTFLALISAYPLPY